MCNNKYDDYSGPMLINVLGNRQFGQVHVYMMLSLRA